MVNPSFFVKCIFAPCLKRIHSSLPVSDLGRNYFPNAMEANSQKILNMISTTKSVLYYTLPVWSVMLYRRGYLTIAFGAGFLKYSLWFACIYFGLLFCRGVGRANNQEYIDFITVLKQGDADKKRNYDFDFTHWPVDFTYDQGLEDKNYSAPPYHLTGRLKKVFEGNSLAYFIVRGLPCELLSYVVSHGFGLSMVYPGSTSLLNAVISVGLQDGRSKLVENYGGKRAKLQTRDGNFIDSMFVNRNKDDASSGSSAGGNGATLVVCCEGNAGFYEVGIMATPLEEGYSVLGWNHPGFGSSTGAPSPAAEINAIDTVMQYATTRLGFEPENIILYGWSIGAFTALHGAILYPEIKELFLDATFDDLVPLAVKAMPVYFENIVKSTMRGYINLHHSELIKDYSGPVHFVRREMDEVMNKDGQRVVSSNCGNPLLSKFLQHRFPQLFGSTEEEKILIKCALDSWLNRDDDVNRTSLLTNYQVEDKKCEKLLKSYIDENTADYPIHIGEGLNLETKQRLVLYLASKHMSHFQSSHCTPLPAAMFVHPWDIRKDLPESYSSDSSQCASSDEFEIIAGAKVT